MEEQKHVHKSLTKGEVVEKTKLEKALGLFLAEDANYISESIMDDFIKPRIKQYGKESLRKFREFVADSLIGCIQMVILGSTSKKNTSSYTSGNGHVSYYAYYDGQPTPISSSAGPDKDAYGLKIVCIGSYGQAEEVLGEMLGFIKRYKYATVADYYQLVDLTPAKTDWSFGWRDLSGARIVRYKTDGYVIELPKPQPIG